MNFVKERNLIVCYDYDMRLGAWNITTGVFIGKSGRPIKSVPSCFSYNNLPQIYSVRNYAELNTSAYLASMIRLFRDWKTTYQWVYNEVIGTRFEQLISLNLIPYERNIFNHDLVLTKDVVNYLKQEEYGVYNTYNVNNFLAKTKYQAYLNTIPKWTHDVFFRLIANGDLPFDYIKAALNRAIKEHIGAFTGEENTYSAKDMMTKVIRNYYTISMAIYNKVEVTPNFLSKYAILRYIDDEYKKTHYNDVLKKNNDLPWLYYENDIFVVRPIITKEAFHDEAAAQHNCVERMYMERVYNKQTHIVTVRKKADPENAFITCEVGNNGQIIQYLAKFNRQPTGTDTIKFRTEYQAHLCLANKK